MSTAMHTAPRHVRFDLLAYLGAGVSLVFCFWSVTFGSIAPLVGITDVGINPHLQAVIMWLFAAVTVFALVRDRERHGAVLPLATGLLAFSIIVGTLYTYYADAILAAGYVLLLFAAVMNQNAMLAAMNRRISTQAAELRELNATLEEQVRRQVAEIGRLARLRRFLSDSVAALLVDDDHEALLESHRRYIVCVFADIRRFTPLTERLDPEDVMNVLQRFHEAAGRCVDHYGGTIGYRAGDGLLVFFNDPLPCEHPDLRAVELAIALRREFADLASQSHRIGADIGLAIGVASGHATIGVIGDEGRYDYTPIGTCVNLAARLSDRAADDEILLSSRTFGELADLVRARSLGTIEVRGLSRDVQVFALEGLVGDVPA